MPELPENTVAERFRAAMERKFALAAPYREPLAALRASLLSARHELGVFNEQTALVRRRVNGVFYAVALGANNTPPGRAQELARGLYGAHLALMWLWSQERAPALRASRAALAVVCRLLKRPRLFLNLPMAKLFSRWLEAAPNAAQLALATRLLQTLFRHRRLISNAGACAENPCEQCFGLHLPRVLRALAANEPVHFLLPAFPAKSPSPRKTLGPLPDMAEEQALKFLACVCAEVQGIYPPGARLTICSDGRVFSDLVGVTEENVTSYGAEIASLIERHNLCALDTFSLEDLYERGAPAEMRERLCAHYAETEAAIAGRVRLHEHPRALFNGLQRFLFEDRIALEPDQSRTQVRNDCKARAYQVMRRSDAWGRLLAECFPHALRLSIHPQPAHSDKIGILLGAAEDVWLTPWHGVAVKRGEDFTLMPRHEAESLGARLIERGGRPSHFEI